MRIPEKGKRFLLQGLSVSFYHPFSSTDLTKYSNFLRHTFKLVAKLRLVFWHNIQFYAINSHLLSFCVYFFRIYGSESLAHSVECSRKTRERNTNNRSGIDSAFDFKEKWQRASLGTGKFITLNYGFEDVSQEIRFLLQVSSRLWTWWNPSIPPWYRIRNFTSQFDITWGNAIFPLTHQIDFWFLFRGDTFTNIGQITVIHTDNHVKFVKVFTAELANLMLQFNPVRMGNRGWGGMRAFPMW